MRFDFMFEKPAAKKNNIFDGRKRLIVAIKMRTIKY